MSTRNLIMDLLSVHPDMTYREIGEVVGCSRAWVHQVAREAGLAKKSRLYRPDITIERVLDLYYHSNLLIKDITRMLGCNELTIRRRLRAGGISSSEAHSRKMKLRWSRVREAAGVAERNTPALV